MKTRIKEFVINWINIKNACRNTVSMGESDKEPTREWKRKLLICRHSPLRKGHITWKWDNIPYAISTHFARHHIGCEKYISTSREDRTGVPREQRSQMDCVSMEMDANIEALQNIAEKRLCMCADKTTREFMEDLKDAIGEYDEDIAWSLVPSGIRCGGCPETFGKCRMCNEIISGMPVEDRLDITKRYDEYNRQYVKRKGGK